jgi:type IV pilus assembly protein PilW
MKRHHRQPAPRAARGFTLVELMIGLAISLALMAGAFAMAGVQLGEHHRLLLELQVQQELRATAELMQRDLRRAAFWDRAQDGVWHDPAITPDANPYADLSIDDAGARLTYSYARDGSSPSGGAGGREGSGFRLAEGRIDQWIAGRYQPLTDPAVMRVTRFDARVGALPHRLGDACDPRLTARLIELSLDVEAAHDRRVSHRVTLTSRLRNDAFSRACP